MDERMSRTKRKSKSHIIDTKANNIIKEILPDYWTIREYKPDYGIDLSIEIFEEADTQDCFDTLGEHIFIQVKGVEKVKSIMKKIYNPNDNTEFYEVDVITFSIDTVELNTVQRMSNAVPVLLFVVDIQNEFIYFMNLNDYIDKVLLISEPNYTNQKSKTLYIPIENCIKNKSQIHPLLYYSKRPKLYALFLQIAAQNNDIGYVDVTDLKDRLVNYAKILLTYDIWNRCSIWPILADYKNKLVEVLESQKVESNIPTFRSFDDNLRNQVIDGDDRELFTEKEAYELMSLKILWKQLGGFHDVYESSHREYFLPTYYHCLINLKYR